MLNPIPGTFWRRETAIDLATIAGGLFVCVFVLVLVAS